jgi:hypothetical protein
MQLDDKQVRGQSRTLPGSSPQAWLKVEQCNATDVALYTLREAQEAMDDAQGRVDGARMSASRSNGAQR